MSRRANSNVSRREFIEAGVVASITCSRTRYQPPSRQVCIGRRRSSAN